MRIASLLVLSLCFISYVAAQESSNTQESPEKRVATILKTLEPDNTLRFSLEHGARGNGIHLPWMDEMQLLQIKHAAFVVGFTWLNGIESLKITDIRFLKRYYRFDSQIKDQKILTEIRSSQLEKELRGAVILRAAEVVPNIMANVRRTANANPKKAHGTLYLNLLDDEILPVLDEMPDVEW